MNSLTMKASLIVLLVLLTPIKPANCFSCRSHLSKHSTQLFGTIRFVGSANARHSTPPINNCNDENKSLSTFLSTSASVPALLGTEISRCRKIDEESEMEVWECRQATVAWFGMTIAPVFINQIEKKTDEESVIISIIDARTEVEKGGRLGNTFISAMKRSKFEGRNVVTWKERDTTSSDQIFALEGSLTLTLTIDLPPFLPLPPGFNIVGSKIVERTCSDRLKLSLQNLSDAYLHWTDTDRSNKSPNNADL